jgi:hypothetical protein
MINFNFGKGSLDFLKRINKRDCFTVFFTIVIVTSLFKEELIEIIPHRERDIFSEGIEQQLELEYVLNDIVKKYNIDYVNINLFHNGTISASGYHFKKMSCVAEGKKAGKLPKIQNLQNWVIDPFKEKIADCKRIGHIYLKNLPEDKDPYFAQQIPRFGINSVFYVGLFDHRKKDKRNKPHFIGFISFGWEKPTNLKEADLVSIEKEKSRIYEFILK